MKKIFLALVVTLAAFAASAQRTASISSKLVEDGNSKGKYVFTLAPDVTSAEVDKMKGYYTSYFTVDFSQTKHEATVTMVSKDEMAHRVIMRFLSGLGMNTVSVDGTDKPLDKFFEEYLK